LPSEIEASDRQHERLLRQIAIEAGDVLGLCDEIGAVGELGISSSCPDQIRCTLV
jgi:hypothetical protein